MHICTYATSLTSHCRLTNKRDMQHWHIDSNMLYTALLQASTVAEFIQHARHDMVGMQHMALPTKMHATKPVSSPSA